MFLFMWIAQKESVYQVMIGYDKSAALHYFQV